MSPDPAPVHTTHAALPDAAITGKSAREPGVDSWTAAPQVAPWLRLARIHTIRGAFGR